MSNMRKSRYSNCTEQHAINQWREYFIISMTNYVVQLPPRKNWLQHSLQHLCVHCCPSWLKHICSDWCRFMLNFRNQKHSHYYHRDFACNSWTCGLYYTRCILLRRQYALGQSMMTSSNGNIFRVTGTLCGEFTAHWWVPSQRSVTWSNWTNGWGNNWDAGELRRNRAHYDVTVMRLITINARYANLKGMLKLTGTKNTTRIVVFAGIRTRVNIDRLPLVWEHYVENTMAARPSHL